MFRFSNLKCTRMCRTTCFNTFSLSLKIIMVFVNQMHLCFYFMLPFVFFVFLQSLCIEFYFLLILIFNALYNLITFFYFNLILKLFNFFKFVCISNDKVCTIYGNFFYLHLNILLLTFKCLLSLKLCNKIINVLRNTYT